MHATNNGFDQQANSDVMADGALILLVRHGQTAANLSGVLQGQQDHPLNATGQKQAAELAGALRHRRTRDKWSASPSGGWAVHSSDLSRASATAAKAAAALGDLPVSTHERLRERKLGPFEGHDEQHNSTQNALAWGRFRRGMSVAGVESCDDVYARASAALVEIAAAHDGKTVVVVTHGGVIVTLAERLTVVGQHVPPIRNCSITALRAPRGGAPFEAWRVESIGDASHLSDGAAAGVANADVR